MNSREMDYSEVGRYQYVDTYPDHRQSSSQNSDSTHHERFMGYPETSTRHSELLRNMPDYTHTNSNYAEPQTYVPSETIQPVRGTEYPRATADNMYSRYERPRCPENAYSKVSNMSRMSSNEPQHRLPFYNGKTEWESFWCQFQIISRSYAWDNQKQATQLLLCLQNEALNFASRLPNAVQTDIFSLFVELEEETVIVHQNKINGNQREIGHYGENQQRDAYAPVKNTFRSFKLERAVPVGQAIAPKSNEKTSALTSGILPEKHFEDNESSDDSVDGENSVCINRVESAVIQTSVRINDYELKAVIDTGAEVTVLSEKVYRNLAKEHHLELKTATRGLLVAEEGKKDVSNWYYRDRNEFRGHCVLLGQYT
ncbi:Hypothetical predicted protein [Mytilus galloprovincialis]|uniref:Peptidase A2 domain-containing protein n=1 Tax=Mytilus galloprovincialis TaxID=29158 RepID=A0A8B6DFA6_MYTGA|nr:Hypothetical predicted protein [Mytilus galloprovincialis]